MALATVIRADLDQHLHRLGLRPGMNVTVHAYLPALGSVVGGAPAVHAALRRAIGGSGTLVIPTYTTELSMDTPFDPATTPGQMMGVLSEYFRQLPTSVRSLCPMHSHAAEGPLSEALARATPSASFGPNTSFDLMHKGEFHLLLLGCPFRFGATFVHHVEAVVGVPYRSWLELPRLLVAADGSIKSIVLRYYGMRRDLGLSWNSEPLLPGLVKCGKVTRVRTPHGHSLLLRLPDLYEHAVSALHHDPEILVRKCHGAMIAHPRATVSQEGGDF
jgi:aminoglycoside N3'-acetyltransferase